MKKEENNLKRKLTVFPETQTTHLLLIQRQHLMLGSFRISFSALIWLYVSNNFH